MAERTCSIDGCGHSHCARGLCNTHYAQWHRAGSDPELASMQPARSIAGSSVALDVALRTREDLAWAAGLFEGEGCFTFHAGTHPNGYRYRYPKACMNSTDRDVMVRFLAIVGCGNLHGPYLTKRDRAYNRKPSWHWRAHGFELGQAIVALFWPWLCERRRIRAAEVLTARPIGRLDD